MPHPKHPLVALHRAHTAPHLVREDLESEAVIGSRQGARDAIAGAGLCLSSEEDFDRFFKAPPQQEVIPIKGHQGPGLNPGLERQVKAVDSIQEKAGPHSLIEVSATPPQGIERCSLFQQVRERCGAAECIE